MEKLYIVSKHKTWCGPWPRVLCREHGSMCPWPGRLSGLAALYWNHSASFNEATCQAPPSDSRMNKPV